MLGSSLLSKGKLEDWLLLWLLLSSDCWRKAWTRGVKSDEDCRTSAQGRGDFSGIWTQPSVRNMGADTRVSVEAPHSTASAPTLDGYRCLYLPATASRGNTEGLGSMNCLLVTSISPAHAT